MQVYMKQTNDFEFDHVMYLKFLKPLYEFAESVVPLFQNYPTFMKENVEIIDIRRRRIILFKRNEEKINFYALLKYN